MFINILPVHHYLSQEGIHTSYKAQCENSKRRNFFTERIVNAWNSLPANVDFSSLLRFKRSVEQVDFSQFMQCDVL